MVQKIMYIKCGRYFKLFSYPFKIHILIILLYICIYTIHLSKQLHTYLNYIQYTYFNKYLYIYIGNIGLKMII